MARQLPPPRDARSSAESSRHFRRSDPCGLSSFFRKLFIYVWLSAEEESSKDSEVKEMLVLILLTLRTRLSGQGVSR